MPKFTWAVFELGLCEELSPQRIALRARWRATKPIPSTFPFRVRLADGAGYMECGTNNSSTGFSRRMECGEGVDALRVPPWLPELNAVSTSSEYVAALTSDGRVLEWNISDPRKFQIREGLSNLVAVTTGMRFTAALSADGTVTGWGQLGPGPFYVPAELSNVVAVAGGNGYCLALTKDGRVAGWGDTTYEGVRLAATVPAGLSGVVAIAANDLHSLALKSDGTVQSWGQLTNVPSALSDVKTIASGPQHSVALRSNGTVVAWGRSSEGQTTVPASLSNVVSVSAGFYSSIALKSDGTIVAWGQNGYGRSYVAPNFEGVAAIAGADSSLFALGGHLLAAPPATSLLAIPQVRTGGSAVFSASVSGTPPLLYQWQFNGNDLPGANSRHLVITNVQLAHSGTYALVVSNAFGSARSRDAVLSVDPTPAETATVWISNALDSGPGSLRQAIADANASPEDDVIGFLTLGLIAVDSPLPEITGNIRILGPGVDLLSVTGKGLHRVFSTAPSTISAFCDFQVADGYVTNGTGAGILNRGTLLLTNVALARNLAEVGCGGGVYNSGHLSMVNSAFWGNVVRGSNNLGGAALYNTGVLIVDSTILSGNRVENSNRNLGGGGGALFSLGSLTAVHSLISSNEVVGADGKFGEPGAEAGFACGGGIFIGGGNATIADCVISRNTARGGNGVWIGSGGAAFGAGLFLQGREVLITNCDITLNMAEGGAGASAFTFAYAGGFARGGGLYVESGRMSLIDCTFKANKTRGGTGGRLHGGALPGGDAEGAGLFVNDCAGGITNSTFVANQVIGADGNRSISLGGGGNGGHGRGGGLSMAGGSVVGVNCTFSGNSAHGGAGGPASSFPDFPTVFPGKGGHAIGGGLSVAAGSLSLMHCTITENQSIAGLGGFLNESYYPTFAGRSSGGGVHSGGGTPKLRNSLIAANSADEGPDGYGEFVSDGFNLIGNDSGMTINTVLATDLKNLAPLLGPLQDNGGPAFTHALLAGSPAIDAGSCAGASSLDQRGFPRPAGGSCDIGAYEFAGPSLITISVDDKARIQFLVWTNQTYPIQATTNMLNWLTIGTIPVSPTGRFIFEDPANLAVRFYRLVLSPRTGTIASCAPHFEHHRLKWLMACRPTSDWRPCFFASPFRNPSCSGIGGKRVIPLSSQGCAAVGFPKVGAGRLGGDPNPPSV